MFHGSNVALITPFSNQSVDEIALVRLVKYHLDNGSHGIVPVGTTGEAPALSAAEQRRVIDIVVHEVAGQVPVIAGAGSNNVDHAIAQGLQAAQAGADAVLHVMGYYNRPSQEGIYQHFAALDRATELPVFVYNVPPRSVIDILPETMARIASLASVVGVKDATKDLSRPLQERRLIDGSFCFLSGEDPTAVAYNAQGGHGCISVTANIAAAQCAQMQEACARDDYQSAVKIQLKLIDLHQALFLEPSPAGVKYASSLLGLCAPDCRLPMVAPGEATKQRIESAMHGLNLL